MPKSRLSFCKQLYITVVFDIYIFDTTQNNEAKVDILNLFYKNFGRTKYIWSRKLFL